MIEATCSACGTINRVAEADVPAGAKFVNCASCKARVGIAVIPAVPPLPKLPPRIPPIGPPSIPLGPAGALPVVPPPRPGKKNDIIDLADLPAPKRPSSLGSEPSSRPAPRSAIAELDAELPAPRSPRAPTPRPVDAGETTGLPAPAARARQSAAPRNVASGKRALTDLPMPPADADDFTDLPAPKHAGGFDDLPAPKHTGGGGFDDLPAPKQMGGGGFDDLPAPKQMGGGGFDDLPAPKQMGGGGPHDNLPAPKHAGGGPHDNLLTPKRGGPHDNLLTPKRGGAIDNLPAPKRSSDAGPDLPAPKGFFDDLPQPARHAPPGNDIAPKGFFDDLPQPARPGAGSREIAPKGFFDDLPQPARPGVGASEIAPKGFFDDLPRPVDAPSARPLDLGDEAIEQIELADDTGGLELESPAGTQNSFSDIDLSSPSKTRGAVAEEAAKAGITFAASTKPATSTQRSSLPSLSNPQGGADAVLELEEPRDTVDASQRLGPRAKTPPPVDDALTVRKRKRKRQAIGAVALGAVLLGGGGFFLYQRHAKEQERVDKISSQLNIARKALTADDANRWLRAAAAAGQVLEIEPAHGEALAISSEALLGGALADGKNAGARIAKGRKQIGEALAASALTPRLDRAQALATLTTNPAAAITKIQALIAKQPKDASLVLYLGWALHAASEHQKAVDAYTTASAGPPGVKILALLGRAESRLKLTDTDGAREDFQAVLALDKDNVPAQVGIAAALPAAQLQQQESDLLAILERKDIPTADPRAVTQAWVLAGNLARRGGRIDAARERYRKALAIDARSVAAAVGLAETELRDNRLDEASAQVAKALSIDKDHAIAQLVSAEIMLREAKLDEAAQRLELLEHRDPPLAPLEQSRLLVVKAKMLELKRDDEGAVAAFVAAAKLSGDLDLTPTMLAVGKLTAMAAKAESPDKAEALRLRADELLSTLAKAAEQDPHTALALGNAYIQARDPVKAEIWLRRAATARPSDVDALYLLGRVLRAQNKGPEAIPQLEKARSLAPDRAEIGLELARTLELVGRLDDAGAIYETLLAASAPSMETRAHAGMFYVKTRRLKQAGEQGNRLLEADRQYAAGHYLHGEGQLADGQLDEARKSFLSAVDRERSAIHLDALGRATESIALQRGKDFLAMQDAALRSYQAAVELEPGMFSSQLGMGRLFVARREMNKAVIALREANRLRADDAEVAFLMGSAYAELGDKAAKKAAVDWLKRSNQLKQDADTAYRLGKLYTDPEINQGGPAIEAFGLATRLAVEEEKKTGKRPEWYPEALYQLGNLSNAVGDEGTACRAWKQYLGTSPKPGPRTEEVQRFLSTSLRGSC